MTSPDQLVVFALGGQRFALKLAAVDSVVRAAEISPLPEAPEIVSGVINVRGHVIPVINVRRRFRISERDILPADHIILARTTDREVALVVDTVFGVIERNEARVADGADIVPGLAYVEGVMKLGDGMIFIHDLNTFLSLEEAATLDTALGCNS